MELDFSNHIFVATDFSDPSLAAIDAAHILAHQLGAKVTLFHTFDPEPLVPPGAIPNPAAYHDRIEQEMTDACRARLGELRQEKLADLQDVDLLVSSGRSAASDICDKAKELNADLIIVATHGRTGFSQLLIGSVAEKVVRHAHCPVLAVRVPKH